MAPFRASGRSNRSGRSQADHDVFEGLPIRQWRQSEATLGVPPAMEELKTGDNAWPELPMPRDASQLAPWTQQLLREARRPRLAKRTQEFAEVDKNDDEDEVEKDVLTGFVAKKWSQLPTHQEEPEREYLAKRRKGLPSLHTAMALQATAGFAFSAPTRKTKVIKADADGNTTVYEVLVPEGQTIEGEVTGDTAMPDALPEKAAPGTVIEGVGIANADGLIVAHDLLAPPRRKNVPPRRVKKGGPGRGRKKVMFGRADVQAQKAAAIGGTEGLPSTTNDAANPEVMDVDTTTHGDGDDTQDQIDEGEDEDGDEGEDGEEGDEGDDDDDREDGEVSDGEIPDPPQAVAPSVLQVPITESMALDVPPARGQSKEPGPKEEESEPIVTELIVADTDDPTDLAEDAAQASALPPLLASADEPVSTAPPSDPVPPPETAALGDRPSGPAMPLATTEQDHLTSLEEPAAVADTEISAVDGMEEPEVAVPPGPLQGNDLLSKFERQLEQQNSQGP